MKLWKNKKTIWGGGYFSNKKKIIVPFLIILAVFLFGTSFALWQITLRQTSTNQITTDCFKLTFEGENDINLENAYPMSYDELENYLPTEVPFHFTITNVCDSRSSVTINLETLGVEGKQLADKYIDFVLYDGSEQYISGIQKFNEHGNVLVSYPLNNENKVIEEAVDAYELYTFTLKENSSREFNLLLYLDPETPALDEVMEAIWQGKITLSAVHKPIVKNYMMPMEIECSGTADYGCENITYNRSNENTSYQLSVISFENTISPYDNAVEIVDFSNDKDNSVLGYYVKDEDQDTYSLHIQADGKIVANEDAGFYFSNYSHFEGLENVDMSYSKNIEGLFQYSIFDTLDMSMLDLSNVENIGKYESEAMFKNTQINELYFSKPFELNTKSLSFMFADAKITNINLTNLNTNKITDMSNMFFNSEVKAINFGNIDTSNVVNMSFMFIENKNLTNLDLSNFNTSNVTTMANMFSGCRGLTSLNLSSFDTSKATNMSYMFSGCNSLTTLDLSSFDTSNVTTMSSMFSYCSNLTSLDLSNFDTSKVTNMYDMFYSSNNLTNINYGTKFIRKSGSSISNMFNNCPANKPTDPSWDGAF